MKKLLIIAIAFLGFMAFAAPAQAQILKTITPVKDTCVNADTAFVNLTPTTSGVIAFHVKAIKVSGTVAGSVVYQGSIDGTNFVTLQTDNLLNAAYNIFSYTPVGLYYSIYRARVITSGTCKINGIRGYNLSRSGR